MRLSLRDTTHTTLCRYSHSGSAAYALFKAGVPAASNSKLAAYHIGEPNVLGGCGCSTLRACASARARRRSSYSSHGRRSSGAHWRSAFRQGTFFLQFRFGSRRQSLARYSWKRCPGGRWHVSYGPGTAVTVPPRCNSIVVFNMCPNHYICTIRRSRLPMNPTGLSKLAFGQVDSGLGVPKVTGNSRRRQTLGQNGQHRYSVVPACRLCRLLRPRAATSRRQSQGAAAGNCTTLGHLPTMSESSAAGPRCG